MEVLVAVAILTICFPVFVLSRQNLAGDRAHRVRLAAEMICHNTLERFGRAEDDLLLFLAAQAGEPGSFEGADLWTHADLAADLGADAARPLIAAHEMHMEVRLQRDAFDGLDLLVCRVSWVLEQGTTNRDSVTYARNILRDANR